ncbi:SH3 domain-containing protein [Gloeothece verrucosa]|uniref:SH3 type 3 domain protein n=1 Tax=Gloeothece verrucosa (strain PCC 7822) TaxID=497965 RepID=E0UIJ8_GLOV7|nr:SH3 domain-containing protein [Gloeothece verrucosa]ADN12192.1 SH3 type 3 domain protein [Gloeothece verrucosa PCC 7822]
MKLLKKLTVNHDSRSLIAAKTLSVVGALALSVVLISLPTLARGISTLRGSGRINVRTQPTINSPAPQYGLAGDQVKVLECVQDRDKKGSDLNWCKVQFVRSKAVGWIRSDFIIFADGGE